MILVLLGTQPLPFYRLINQLDDLVKKNILCDKIIIQNGYTQLPESLNKFSSPFLDKDTYNSFLKNAELIICHGGAGSIFEALNQGKKIIVLPRLQKFGEHVDDHQIELVNILSKNNLIIAEDTLENSFKKLSSHKFTNYTSNTQEIITTLEELINQP